MEHSGTRNATGATSEAECVTNPGYGNYDGEVRGAARPLVFFFAWH